MFPLLSVPFRSTVLVLAHNCLKTEVTLTGKCCSNGRTLKYVTVNTTVMGNKAAVRIWQ